MMNNERSKPSTKALHTSENKVVEEKMTQARIFLRRIFLREQKERNERNSYTPPQASADDIVVVVDCRDEGDCSKMLFD